MIAATKIKAKIEQAKQLSEDSIYKESVDSICQGIDKALQSLPDDYTDSFATCAVVIERGRLFANWSSAQKPQDLQEMLRIVDPQTGSTISPNYIRSVVYPQLTTKCIDIVEKEVLKHGYSSVKFEYDRNNATNDTIVVRIYISWVDVPHEMLLETAPVSHIADIINEHNADNSYNQDTSGMMAAMLVADMALDLVDILE